MIILLMVAVATRALGLILCGVKTIPTAMILVQGRAPGDLIFEGKREGRMSYKFPIYPPHISKILQY